MTNALISRLSKRQIACLQLVAELKKTEQIAAELGISPSTVNTHIERAMVILGAHSRREAARMVTSATGETAPDSGPEERPTEFHRLADPHPGDAIVTPAAALELPIRNRMSPFQRVGLALLALVLLCVAIAGLGAAIEVLSVWRSSLAPAQG